MKMKTNTTDGSHDATKVPMQEGFHYQDRCNNDINISVSSSVVRLGGSEA